MINKRNNFFDKYKQIETVLNHSKYEEFRGVYSQIKYYKYLKLFGPFRTTLKKFNIKYILQIPQAFISIILPFRFINSKKKWVFLSGRNDVDGKDKYLREYLSNSIIWHYGPNPNLKGINLFVFKTLMVLISLLPIYKRKIKDLENLLPIEIYRGYPKRKIREYYLWCAFWKKMILLLNPDEIFFTSVNFFLPLIKSADDLNVKTIEVAHAFLHKFHPSYSVNFNTRKYILASKYVENNSSSNSNIDFPKDLEFVEYKRKRISKKFNTILQRFIIIGKPNLSQKEINLCIKISKSKFSIDEILVIKHPLDESRFKIPQIKFIDLNDFEKSKYVDTIIGWSSNLLLEFYYEGDDVYFIDKNVFDIFHSRVEKISFIDTNNYE